MRTTPKPGSPAKRPLTKSTPASKQANTTARGGELNAQSLRAPRDSVVEAKPAAPTRASAINQQAIAEAAYYLWLERGGDEVSNWLEAEARLSQASRR